jgi:hypothetical protein
MRQLFRGMIRDSDGRPRVLPTARGLGIRPDIDIPIDEDGVCYPETGGMSVAYDSPQNLPTHRRPAAHGGSGPDPIWEIDEAELPDSLAYREDPDLEGHGFVEPAWAMDFEDYEVALAETRDLWRINN